VIYAENRLSAWATWAKEHRESLGFPNISLLYKAMRQKAMKFKGRAEARSMTAKGGEMMIFRPREVGDVPEPIVEVDVVVAQLPRDLNEVIMADYFTAGPIEARCRVTRWRKARYSQLLECAKYTVYATLASRTEPAL
jgi:hypothetical protein